MTEQAKVPAIRFAGFTDPWEQRKFSNLTDRVSMQSSDPDLPQVEYEDIVSGEGTLNKDLRDKEGGKTGIKFYAGDVLYGKLRPYLMNWLYPQFNGVAVGDFWVLRATECDSSFLYRLVQTDSFQRLANVSSGSKMPRADWNLISQSFFAVPADYAEQRVIAKSLAELDDLITLHQRKYDKLVIFKKSMLEKMFPKDGESVPEIRFAGFTDPWEQRKLSEVATFGGGHTPPMADPDNYEDGYVLWVTSQDVKSNYLDRTTTQITEKGAKELTLYPAGSLVMVTRSGILRHTLPVAELRKPSTVNQDIRVILPQGECCGEWLLQFFISHNKELLLEFGKTGTTVESVDFGKIKDMLLYMPSTVEQQQIGDFFAKLDSLITLHQRKLELLQNIKKSLLDKMFV